MCNDGVRTLDAEMDELQGLDADFNDQFYVSVSKLLLPVGNVGLISTLILRLVSKRLLKARLAIPGDYYLWRKNAAPNIS